MKTSFYTFSKRVTFTIAVLFISALSIQAGHVQGKASIRPTAGTTPVVGATVTLTPVPGTGSATSPTTATTTSNGSFSLAGLKTGHYTLTITPAVVYTKSGQAANQLPFQVWANFNMLKGLTVNNILANTAPTGPIAFMSNGSLNVIAFAFGNPHNATTTITGTLTR